MAAFLIQYRFTVFLMVVVPTLPASAFYWYNINMKSGIDFMAYTLGIQSLFRMQVSIAEGELTKKWQPH